MCQLDQPSIQPPTTGERLPASGIGMANGAVAEPDEDGALVYQRLVEARDGGPLDRGDRRMTQRPRQRGTRRKDENNEDRQENPAHGLV